MDLSNPIVVQALKILANQYAPTDEAHHEIQRGEFCRETIAPRDAVAAIVAAIRSAPEGHEIVDLDTHQVMPNVTTEDMLDIGGPLGEIHNWGFDREGAYADLTATQIPMGGK